MNFDDEEKFNPQIEIQDVNIDELKIRILIVAKNPRSLKNSAQFLSRRGWNTDVMGDMNKIIEFVVSEKPDLVLISYDHPNPNITKLPAILGQTFNSTCVGFVEEGRPEGQNRLQKAKLRYKMKGSASGPAIQRYLRTVLNEIHNPHLTKKEAKKSIGKKGKSSQSSMVKIKGGEKPGSKQNPYEYKGSQPGSNDSNSTYIRSQSAKDSVWGKGNFEAENRDGFGHPNKSTSIGQTIEEQTNALKNMLNEDKDEEEKSKSFDLQELQGESNHQGSSNVPESNDHESSSSFDPSPNQEVGTDNNVSSGDALDNKSPFGSATSSNDANSKSDLGSENASKEFSPTESNSLTKKNSNSTEDGFQASAIKAINRKDALSRSEEEVESDSKDLHTNGNDNQEKKTDSKKATSSLEKKSQASNDVAKKGENTSLSENHSNQESLAQKSSASLLNSQNHKSNSQQSPSERDLTSDARKDTSGMDVANSQETNPLNADSDGDKVGHNVDKPTNKKDERKGESKEDKSPKAAGPLHELEDSNQSPLDSGADAGKNSSTDFSENNSNSSKSLGESGKKESSIDSDILQVLSQSLIDFQKISSKELNGEKGSLQNHSGLMILNLKGYGLTLILNSAYQKLIEKNSLNFLSQVIVDNFKTHEIACQVEDCLSADPAFDRRLNTIDFNDDLFADVPGSSSSEESCVLMQVLNQEIKAAEIGDKSIDSKIKISLETLRTDLPVGFNLYLFFKENQRYYRYLGKGRTLSEKQKKRLSSADQMQLFVEAKDKEQLRNYLFWAGILKVIEDFESEKKAAA